MTTTTAPFILNGNEKYLFCEALKEYGGHFCRGLAVALERADSANTRRLLAAFPELLADYGPDGPFYRATQAYQHAHH